jgi:hypothetical protein
MLDAQSFFPGNNPTLMTARRDVARVLMPRMPRKLRPDKNFPAENDSINSACFDGVMPGYGEIAY